MIARIAWLLLGGLAAVVMITLAVANRHAVQLVLDPFNPQRPVLAAELPFYVYLFGAMLVGVIMGGVASWTSQGKWRRAARLQAQEIARLKGESSRLRQELDASVSEKAAVNGGDRKQLALMRR